MIKNIIEIIQENKPDVEILATSELFESGLLDSFDLLVLVTDLECKFDVSIPGEMLIPEHFSTPELIANLLSSL
jgi:acyl carrier protein